MSDLVESSRETGSDLAKAMGFGAKVLVVTLGGLGALALVVVTVLGPWVGRGCSIPRRDLTRSSAKSLHAVVESWRANHPDACPTFDRLLAEKELAASSVGVDAWGSPWIIECRGDETIVTSVGPDRRRGTGDDVVVPEVSR